MNRLRSFSILSLILPLLGLAAASQAEPPNYDLVREAGDIKGIITVCGELEVDVLVFAPGTSFSAFTDGNGSFRLSYVQQGTYDLVIKKGNTPLGVVSQVAVTKKQTVDIGTHEVCSDADGDGYSPPQDCDDENPQINPAAAEICGDGVDNNCDGTTDEGCTGCTDNDLDGFFAQTGCLTPVDCDDSDPSINPQATESCDGTDNDCDGLIDESGSNQTNYYIDVDGDGYGATDISVLACSPPSGYVSQPGDCDDDNLDVNPAATELCDGIDNDCNSATADGTEEQEYGQACDGSDIDQCAEGIFVCTGFGGLACNDTTQDDLEFCDGIDNDCDGMIDEDLPIGSLCPVGPNVSSTVCLGNSGCAINSCNSGYNDCDSFSGNGCETDISTVSNCGACSNECPTGNICVAGECTLP